MSSSGGGIVVSGQVATPDGLCCAGAVSASVIGAAHWLPARLCGRRSLAAGATVWPAIIGCRRDLSG